MFSVLRKYRLLWVACLFLFIFELNILAADTKSEKVTDDEILKRLGVDRISSESDQNNKQKADENESLPETNFEKQEMEFKIHTVKAGESLSVIAKAYYEDYNKIALIAEYNNIKNIDRLKVGQKIKIPILELKRVAPEQVYKEEDLSGPKKAENRSIEETDLKGKKLISKEDYLSIAIFIIVYLLMIMFFLFIKLISIENRPNLNEFVDKNHKGFD